jgi:uncharacterized protein (TIGR02145 family)
MKTVKFLTLASFLLFLVPLLYGQDFRTVKIGNQVWMVENLNVSTFWNGDPIPEVKSVEGWREAGKEGKPAWCHYESDLANGEIFGKLYNWYAVNDARGLAPEGWHVPTDEEWQELVDYLGGKDIAGNRMKSTGGWKDDGIGSNRSGFYALPSGVRVSLGMFLNMGFTTSLWSSSEDIICWSLSSWGSNAARLGSLKGSGFSVRCIKN